MQSIRSKLIIGLVRNRHLFKGQLKRPVVDETFSVEEFRTSIDRASESANRRLKHAKISALDINGLYAEWIDTEGTMENKVILYIHGGGFISGSCHTHRGHVLKFVKQSGIRALLFDYRLAPEHPFPAALDDCVTAYKWLLDQGVQPDDIVVAGESAGGTLTLSTLMKIKSLGLPQPAGAVSISPVTDLRCLADSFERNAKKDIAPYNSWTVWTGLYIANADPTDPDLSPQFGDTKGLAPLYLCVGTHEIHHDDTVAFHKKVQESGGKSELHVYKNMVHAFPILAPMFPEATKALNDICRFIQAEIK